MRPSPQTQLHQLQKLSKAWGNRPKHQLQCLSRGTASSLKPLTISCRYLIRLKLDAMTMLQFWVPISESGLNFLTVSPFVTYQEVCVRGGGVSKVRKFKFFLTKLFTQPNTALRSFNKSLKMFGKRNSWEKVKQKRMIQLLKTDSAYERSDVVRGFFYPLLKSLSTLQLCFEIEYHTIDSCGYASLQTGGRVRLISWVPSFDFPNTLLHHFQSWSSYILLHWRVWKLPIYKIRSPQSNSNIPQISRKTYPAFAPDTVWTYCLLRLRLECKWQTNLSLRLEALLLHSIYIYIHLPLCNKGDWFAGSWRELRCCVYGEGRLMYSIHL